MRSELTEIELIEKYLMGKLSDVEKQEFEIKLKANNQFKIDIEKQKLIMESINRQGLLTSANKGLKKFKVMKALKYTGTTVAIVGTAAAIYVGVKYMDTKKEDASSSIITPPIEEIKVNEVNFIYTNSEGGKHETAKGSTIILPPNSLSYENGDQITEPVKITFNEFESMAEIALSGIPMQYDSNGTQFDFRSGGMFSINAKVESGKKVIIKPTNDVTINLASYKNENFNFYKINEETGQWTYKAKETKQLKIKENIIDFPEPPTNDDLVLDLNISKYNGVYDVESSLWKLDENLSSETKKIIEQTNWTKYEIEAINEDILLYKIKLTNKNNSIEANACPVISKAQTASCKQKFQQKIKASQKDLASNYYKPKVIRSVYLKEFGSYNFDAYSKQSNRILANYQVEGVNESDLKLYQFDLTKDMMFKVSKTNGDLFFNPNSKNVLIALLPKKGIAVYSPKNYERLYKLNKGAKVAIELTKLDKTIESADDLQKLITSYN